MINHTEMDLPNYKHPNQNNSFWTDEKIKELTELHEQNFSCAEIAAKMGAPSRNSVIGKLHRLGLNHKDTSDFWFEKEITILKDDWSHGMAVVDIGIDLNKQCGTVRTPRAIVAKADRIGLASKKERKFQSFTQFRALPFEPIEIPLAFKPLNIPFVKLENVHCREVMGHGDDGLAIFCGHARTKNHPYCEIHSRINYYKWKAA